MKRQYLIFLGLLLLTGWLTSIAYHKIHPEWVVFAKGEQYLEEKQIKQALEAYEMASKLGLSHPKLFLRLAYCYSELSEYETAIVWYAAYLKERPTDIIARYRYPHALTASGQGEAAIREYKIISEKGGP